MLSSGTSPSFHIHTLKAGGGERNGKTPHIRAMIIDMIFKFKHFLSGKVDVVGCKAASAQPFGCAEGVAACLAGTHTAANE